MCDMRLAFDVVEREHVVALGRVVPQRDELGELRRVHLGQIVLLGRVGARVEQRPAVVLEVVASR